MEAGGEGLPQRVRFPTPQNDIPAIFMTGFNAVKLIVETYGWFLLIAVLGVLYVYQKYKPSYDKWKQKQEHLRDAEENKNNPDQAYAIQLSMEEARGRLQERVSADSEIRRIRENEIAEQKRLQKIEEWEKHQQGKGYHSKSKPREKSPDVDSKQFKPKRKNDFRPEFNPLSGGGSSGYRPSRRNASGGG